MIRRTLPVLAAAALLSLATVRAAEPAREAVELKQDRAAAPAAPAAPKPREVAKDAKTSDAVTEQDVEFAAFAAPTWAAPAAGATTKVEFGLKVTNKAELAMQFNEFDTITVVIRDAGGKALAHQYMRDATRLLPPRVIQKGATALVFRDGTLDGAKLTVNDGTGGVAIFDGLKPGSYTLSFEYACDERRWAPLNNRRTTAVIDPKVAPFWNGKVVTKDVAFEVK